MGRQHRPSTPQEAGMREAIRDPVIIGGARTPIGRLLGSLAGFTAAELGGKAMRRRGGGGQGSALLLRVPS
jgi:acetyl-CoA acetyltransferase